MSATFLTHCISIIWVHVVGSKTREHIANACARCVLISDCEIVFYRCRDITRYIYICWCINALQSAVFACSSIIYSSFFVCARFCLCLLFLLLHAFTHQDQPNQPPTQQAERRAFCVCVPCRRGVRRVIKIAHGIVRALANEDIILWFLN